MKGLLSNGAQCQKTCLRGFANNKGVDHPAHMRSLISTFVVCLTESIMSRHSPREISMFWLVYVAEQANLNITLSDSPKTGFVMTQPKYTGIQSNILMFQRCIVMRRFYISYKQIKMTYSLPHAYAVFCGRLIITVN